MKKLLLLAPLVAVILVSGCTMPDIPFLSGLFGPQVVKYDNDIVIIRSLDATPNTIFPGQSARLTAYIQNQGKETLNGVVVDLYDYCAGTLNLVGDPTCGSDASVFGSSKSGCTINELYPYETREIRWTLKADDKIKLQTTCPTDGVKVSVNYAKETTGLSTISLIDEAEMQRQMSAGSYKEKQSYIVAGEGPIKGYILVEDKQPIPVNLNGADGGNSVISFQLKNEGNGFLARPPTSTAIQAQPNAGTTNTNPLITIKEFDITNDITIKDATGNCGSLKPEGQLPLILKESPKVVCSVDIKNTKDVTKELSKTLQFKIAYNYEFRASTKITVMPKLIS